MIYRALELLQTVAMAAASATPRCKTGRPPGLPIILPLRARVATTVLHNKRALRLCLCAVCVFAETGTSRGAFKAKTRNCSDGPKSAACDLCIAVLYHSWRSTMITITACNK
jgi:hypothetical protein